MEQAGLLLEAAVEVRFLPRVLVELLFVYVVCPYDRRRVAKGGVATPPSNEKILLLLRGQVPSPLWGDLSCLAGRRLRWTAIPADQHFAV